LGATFAICNFYQWFGVVVVRLWKWTSLPTIGAVLGALGAAWCAIYFIFVLRYIPDYSAVALQMPIVGAIGTTLLILQVGLTCITGLALRIMQPEIVFSSFKSFSASVAKAPPLQIRSTLLLFSWLLVCSLFALFTLRLCNSSSGILFSVIMLSAVLISVAAFIAEAVGQDPSHYAACSLVWCCSLPCSFLIFYEVNSQRDQVNGASYALLTIFAAIFSWLSTYLTPRALAWLPLAYFMVIGSVGGGVSILAAPLKLLNIGYNERLLTTSTHAAAQTALDCGYPGLHHHFSVLVLTNVGASYVIWCPKTNHSMVIPHAEATDRSIF
jgi:hypothetical protein